MARVGKKQAAQLLRRIVKEHGPETRYSDVDKKYHAKTGDCRYATTKGAAKCIVGVALIDHLGVDPKLLKTNEFVTSYEYRDWLTEILTPDAIQVFQLAQSQQDVNLPWGEAVAKATAGIR